jgi:hypothetical protein
MMCSWASPLVLSHGIELPHPIQRVGEPDSTDTDHLYGIRE